MASRVKTATSIRPASSERQAHAGEGPQGHREAEALRVLSPEGRGVSVADERVAVSGRAGPEVVLQPGQGARETQPGAGGHEEHRCAEGDAKAGTPYPAPAEQEPRRQQDEPAHREQGEEAV